MGASVVAESSVHALRDLLEIEVLLFVADAVVLQGQKAHETNQKGCCVRAGPKRHVAHPDAQILCE